MVAKKLKDTCKNCRLNSDCNTLNRRIKRGSKSTKACFAHQRSKETIEC